MLAEQIDGIRTETEVQGPSIGLAAPMKKALGEFNKNFDWSDLPALRDVDSVRQGVMDRVHMACEGVEHPKLREMLHNVAPVGPSLAGHFAEVLPRVFFNKKPNFTLDDIRDHLGGQGFIDALNAFGRCSSLLGGNLRDTFFSARFPLPDDKGYVLYNRGFFGVNDGMMEDNFELLGPEDFLAGTPEWMEAVRHRFRHIPPIKPGGCPAQDFLRIEGASLLEDIARWTARQHQHAKEFPIFLSPWSAEIQSYSGGGAYVPFPLNPELYFQPTDFQLT